ncbi:MAG: hypothetical protein WCW26_02930 [Candidatus Buchananbacteria bacterium]
MKNKINKIFIYILSVLAGILLIVFAVIFLLNHLDSSPKPYLAKNVSLVFSDQNSQADFQKLDFLIADLKKIRKTVTQTAVVMVDNSNQNKNIFSLVSLADNFYIDIFTNKLPGNLSLAVFDNQFDLKLPFEIKSYLTENNDLKIIYDKKQKDLKFVFSGQDFEINNEILKLNDLIVLKIEGINDDSLVKIGDSSVDLANYQNNLTTSITNLQKTPVKIYQPKDSNLLINKNHSFEKGAWTGQVSDCSAYLGGQPKIGMTIKDGGTNGNKLLELSSQNHFACTYNTFNLNFEPNRLYRLSFDYKTVVGDKIQYYYNLKNSADKTQEKFGLIKTPDANWHTFVEVFNPEFNAANSFSLYFYAPSDGFENLVNQYDNVSLSSYFLIKEIQTSNLVFPQNYDLGNWFLLDRGKNYFQYIRSTKNLLKNYNPSFETGLWQKKVEDCSNYLTGMPQLGMALKNNGTAGRQSLTLSAKNHFACTFNIFPVRLERNKIYQLSFDYKTVAGNKIQYYYNLKNNRWQQQDKFESITTQDSNWHTFSTVINPNIENADSFSLYFYAPADSSEILINQYDNLKLEEFTPKEIYSYYLYAQQKNDLSQAVLSQSTPAKRFKTQVDLVNVNQKLLLVYPEKFSFGWKAYLAAPTKLNRLNLFLFSSIDSEYHFKTDNYNNAWLIDIENLCRQSDVCIKNSDGSFNLSLVIQNDLIKVGYISLIFSIGFLISAIILFWYEKKI